MRRRVVLSFPLTRPALDQLTAAAGDAEFVDIRDADGSEEVVVCRSVSRQLVLKLRQAFPDATLLVVEVEDPRHDLGLGGPITEALRWGAHGYYVAHSLEQFGALLRQGSHSETQDTPAEIGSAEHIGVNEIVDEIVRRRAAPARDEPQRD